MIGVPNRTREARSPVRAPYPPCVPAPADDDHALAARLARLAGEELSALQRDLIEQGVDRWTLMDAGDLAAHQLLVDALAAERPGDAVLSEEGRDHRAERLAAERVWILDPLDGTQEFGEPYRREWAVHVALVEGGVVSAAAVALPAWGELLGTQPPPPPPPAAQGRGPRVVTGRWRATGAAFVVAQALGADLVALGGAGAKAMAVVLGDADVYAATGLNEWDAAAPAGVALAAGLHVTRFDGGPVTWNQPDPWVPDLLVCRPELAEAALAALAPYLPDRAS